MPPTFQAGIHSLIQHLPQDLASLCARLGARLWVCGVSRHLVSRRALNRVHRYIIANGNASLRRNNREGGITGNNREALV